MVCTSVAENKILNYSESLLIGPFLTKIVRFWLAIQSEHKGIVLWLI